MPARTVSCGTGSHGFHVRDLDGLSLYVAGLGWGGGDLNGVPSESAQRDSTVCAHLAAWMS